ncbi:MAG TPA: hypothetical protein VM054_02495 [bacterium]|nr:hypothetical protein [bacterium]
MHKIVIFLAALGAACLAAEYQFSTGDWDQSPTSGGSAGGWGEWLVTTFENDTGGDIALTELGMPCCGPASEDYGWLVWYDLGGLWYPPGNPTSADRHGPFTPESPSDYHVYTYVDLSGEDVVIEEGTFFAVGYDVTDRGGQIAYNGYTTWAWYSGQWDPDYGWGATSLIQCRAETTDYDFEPPWVDGLDPADGESEVPFDTDIVFHCMDDISGIDTDTIDFTAQDSTLSGGRALSAGAALSVTASPARTLPGDLDIDDTDLHDVVCTWDSDDDFVEGVIVTCTVDGGLADLNGNEMGDDFVWTFDSVGAVENVTWGLIKGEF